LGIVHPRDGLPLFQIKLATEPIRDQEKRLETFRFDRDVLRENNFPTLAVWQNRHFNVWEKSVEYGRGERGQLLTQS
jgi:hypothetical protein